MNDAEITQLVAVRNQITDRETPITATRTLTSVDMIDAMLREIPQGHRPDVDKLLGRAWFQNQAVTVEQADPLAGEKMNAFHDYEQGLSAEDVAQIVENRKQDLQ